MFFAVIGVAFFCAGLLLVANFKGFTETTFNFITRFIPVTPNTTYRIMRVVGAGWVFIGGIFMLVGFTGAGDA